MDWAGRYIHPTGDPFDRTPKPQAYQYWSTTSQWSKSIAQTLNEWTGGNEVRPGAFDVYPDTLEQIYEFLTGGAGRFIDKTIDVPTKLARGEPVSPYEIPFARKFYGEVWGGTTRDQYYAAARDVLYAHDELKGVNEKRDAIGASRVKRDQGWKLQLYGFAKGTRKRIQALKDRRERYEQSRLSAAAKRREIERVDDEIDTAMQRFNKMYMRGSERAGARQ